MKNQTAEGHNDFFSTEIVDNIAVITFKGKTLLPFSSLRSKEQLFDYLDFTSESDSTKVVVLTDRPGKSSRNEYREFYSLLANSEIHEHTLRRLYNAYNQLVLKILQSGKFFVSAPHGEIISQDFNVQLACDYRIMTKKARIYKPYLDAGLVPKGGGVYFLKNIVGRNQAADLLLSHEPLTAENALQVGIVNKIVPDAEIDNEALRIAKRVAQYPATSLAGIKKLLNYPLKDVEEFLKFENTVLLDILTPRQFSVMNKDTPHGT